MDYPSVYSWLQDQIANNQFFAGGLVMGLIGWAAVALRAVPGRIAAVLWKTLTTEVEIKSLDGDAFVHLALWLSRHSGRRHARRLGMISYWDSSADQDGYELTFGFGEHLIWSGLTPVFLKRSINEDTPGQPVQTIVMRVLGRSQRPILKILEEAREAGFKSERTCIRVWRNGHWTIADRKAARPIESVVMPTDLKQMILSDLSAFASSREWHRKLGLPWRRGYLLEGPPGTGKSSLIGALAGIIGKDLCIINAATVSDDNELLEAFAQARDNVVVLEDIDAIKISNRRPDDADDADANESKRITLSGLLNAIDGVASRDGRVLFMTSNKPDVLDDALLRPGRVDMRINMDLVRTDELAREMYSRFCQGLGPADDWLASISLPMSPAEMQASLLAYAKEGGQVVIWI